VGVAACVPASDERQPKGGVGFLSVPSAATRGEPFVTSDGWTVRIESIVLEAAFTADYTGGYHGAHGEESRWRFQASQPVEGVIRGLETAEVDSEMNLLPNVSWNDTDEQDCKTHPYVDPCGHDLIVDPTLKARLQETADGERPEGCGEHDGSSRCSVISSEYSHQPAGFYLKASATKDGRSVSLDLALSLTTKNIFMQNKVIVRANEFAIANVALEGERLFRNPAGVLVFEDLARADANGDGNVTAFELKAVGALYQPPAEERRQRIIARSEFVGSEGEHIPLPPEEPRPLSTLEVVCERSAGLLTQPQPP
jgi:hypothetical protein